MSKIKRNSTSVFRRVLVAVSIVLGLIFVVLLAGTVYAEYLLGKVNYVDPDATEETLSQEELDAFAKETEAIDLEFTGPVVNEEDVELETVESVEVDGEQVVNILLIGVDRRHNEKSRSDSMILCTFNKYAKTITLTSFMRDMYVKIPGYSSNRINASYYFGGMKKLNETLNYNFGVETDATVEIDFNNFQKLIDLLGGIELDLNTKEANYINKETGSKLKAGVQVLTGEQALWYSRYRKDGGGDFNRTNRQRIVLTTLLNEYKNQSLTDLMGMMDDILPMVTTNMTKDEVVDYVTDLFPMLAGAEIVTQRIPAEGAFYQAKINEMAVLVPNIPKNVELLKEAMEVPEEAGYTGGVG